MKDEIEKPIPKADDSKQEALQKMPEVEDPYHILSDGELEADGIPEKKPLLTKVVL